MTQVTTDSLMVFVSPEIEELQHEMLKHPKLMEELTIGNIQNFEDGLAIIAAHCDVVMHGEYTGNDIRVLCGKLVGRLREKRGAIIIPSDVNKI